MKVLFVDNGSQEMELINHRLSNVKDLVIVEDKMDRKISQSSLALIMAMGITSNYFNRHRYRVAPEEQQSEESKQYYLKRAEEKRKRKSINRSSRS